MANPQNMLRDPTKVALSELQDRDHYVSAPSETIDIAYGVVLGCVNPHEPDEVSVLLTQRLNAANAQLMGYGITCSGLVDTKVMTTRKVDQHLTAEEEIILKMKSRLPGAWQTAARVSQLKQAMVHLKNGVFLYRSAGNYIQNCAYLGAVVGADFSAALQASRGSLYVQKVCPVTFYKGEQASSISERIEGMGFHQPQEIIAVSLFLEQFWASPHLFQTVP